MRPRNRIVGLAMLPAVVMLAACQFDPARPFTWSYNVMLNVPIAANQQQEYAFFRLPQAFEFPAARMARAQGRVMMPAAQGDSLPSMFHWQVTQYDDTFQMKAGYDWVIPLTKRCNARYCVGKFREKETDFPAFNFAAGDYASLSVTPVAGNFPLGVQLSSRLRYDF